jgi:hypothetical protein
MSVVRLWPTKLIIGNNGTGADGSRPTGQVLQLPAAPHVPYQDIQHAARPKPQNTAIMISSQRLTGICLKSPQPDQIQIVRQRGAIPNKPIYAVAQQGHVGKLV